MLQATRSTWSVFFTQTKSPEKMMAVNIFKNKHGIR